MSRSYDFTEAHETIRGMFWFPGCESESFHGVLHLEAGESARLETAQFNSHGLLNLFPGARTKKGEQLKLMGKAVMKAMHAPGKKMIYGHDEHGEPLTLLDCHSSRSRSTFAMASHQYTCKAAIFGRHFDENSLKFDKIRLHFDHFNRWVGRCAFSNYGDYEAEGEKRRLSKVIVPIAQNLEISLGLEGYSDSQIYCGWYQQIDTTNLHFIAESFSIFVLNDRKRGLILFKKYRRGSGFLVLVRGLLLI